MGNQTLSLTDEIYAELVDGLKAGLDWTQFLAKHGGSKGPLYNAIGRFFNDMEPKVAALNEVQARLDEAGLKLDSLDQRIKEAESSLAPLEEKRKVLNEQIETLETKLAQKGDLIRQVEVLEKLGLDMERLRQLQDALGEIGTKHGLKGKEAASKFFEDLKGYDAGVGLEREIQRLEAIATTKKLEAEKWQAEADGLARRHKGLSEAIKAVQSLIKRGVKTEQIVSWHGIVSKLGGPEELQGKLAQYGSMSELLTTKKKEIENYGKKIKELSAQIKALNEQKEGIEGAIKSLSASGVEEIAKVGDKAVTGLKSLSTSGVNQITEVSGKALTELESLSTSGVNQITEVSGKAVAGLESLSASGVKEVTKVSGTAMAELRFFLTEIRGETKRLADLEAEAGKLEKELMYARYLTTGDQAVLKAFPKEVVFAFLDRASSYCKLNDLNPKVRMPDHIYEKYYNKHSTIVWAHPEVSLLDLVTWAEAGLAGAS